MLVLVRLPSSTTWGFKIFDGALASCSFLPHAPKRGLLYSVVDKIKTTRSYYFSPTNVKNKLSIFQACTQFPIIKAMIIMVTCQTRPPTIFCRKGKGNYVGQGP